MPWHDQRSSKAGGSSPIPPTGLCVQALTSHNIDTSALGADTGKACYLDGAGKAQLTDNANVAKSVFYGIWNGTAGELVTFGQTKYACRGPIPVLFTTVGGAPANGAPVYLAAAADEAGAAGKLTATKPVGAGATVFKVGVCEDNSGYAGGKTSMILIQPQLIGVNP